ncbi:site-specific integrase [Rhodohalobacter halophilus]|uniref:site-specific integrase n=1 Tax=Rhodohalobacter halophilus TaxID=1812810 RepID=UPI00083FD576|nr:site-specific integrase [Rhodohalobacter halophilus]
MKTTIKPFLLKRRKTADDLYPVYFRITQQGSYSLYSAEIYIDKDMWNKRGNYIKRNWIKDHPSADAWNNQIYKIWKRIEDIIEQNPGINRKQIVKKLNNDDQSGEVVSFVDKQINSMEDDGQYHQAKHFRVLLNKIQDFVRSSDDYSNEVRFSDIDVQFLEDFKEWLGKDQFNDDGSIQWKANHVNTISKEMVRLKRLLKEANKQGYIRSNPFDDPHYNKVATVKSKKKALSIEQIERIEALELEKGSSLWHVRNYFLFSFWNAGIRFTDLALLKWENIKDGRLIYEMGKNGKEKNIKLLQPAIEILSHYKDHPDSIENFIFPIIQQKNLTPLGLKKKAGSANAIVNRDLKEIQKMADIQTNISFHISRHSFARWAKKKGLSLEAIGKALAHSDRATTEQYLDDLREYDADSELETLFLSKGKN